MFDPFIRSIAPGAGAPLRLFVCLLAAASLVLAAAPADAGSRHGYHGHSPKGGGYSRSRGGVHAPAVRGWSGGQRASGRSYSPSRFGYRLYRKSGGRHHIRRGHGGKRHGHYRHYGRSHGSAIVPPHVARSGVRLGGGGVHPSGHSRHYKPYRYSSRHSGRHGGGRHGYRARFYGGSGSPPVYYGPNYSHGRGSIAGDVAIVIGGTQNAAPPAADDYSVQSGPVLEEGCDAGGYCSLRLGYGPSAPKIITRNTTGERIN